MTGSSRMLKQKQECVAGAMSQFLQIQGLDVPPFVDIYERIKVRDMTAMTRDADGTMRSVFTKFKMFQSELIVNTFASSDAGVAVIEAAEAEQKHVEATAECELHS